MIHFARYGWMHTRCGLLVKDVTTVTREASATCPKCRNGHDYPAHDPWDTFSFSSVAHAGNIPGSGTPIQPSGGIFPG